MKCGKFFYICLIVLCLVLGYWQSENLQDVWREYKSFHKHFIYDGFYFRMTDVSIPERVAVNDPEAAAVAQVKLITNSHLAEEQRIDAFLESHKRFPGNEYILLELVGALSRCEGSLDPAIVLRYTERLIELNPDNVNYRLIKCKLLIDDLSDDNISLVLDELRYANECSQYPWPYEKYKQQALEIAYQAGLGRHFLSMMAYNYRGYPYFYEINKKLIAYANMAFADGQKDVGLRITTALSDTQQHLIQQGDPYYTAITNLGFLDNPYSFGHWWNPQGLELQRSNLTKEQARNNRLQLCSLMLKKTFPPPQQKDPDEYILEKIWNVSLAVPLAVHCGKMFIAFIVSAVIIFVICLKQGFGQKVKVSSCAVILFFLSCFYFFCISRIDFVHAFIKRFDVFFCGCQFWIHYVHSFRPTPGWSYFEDEPLASSLILAVPIIAAVIFWRISVISQRKGAFWSFWNLRFISLLLLTTFLGAAGILLRSISYIRYIPMVIFILTAALVANIKPGQDSVFRSVTRYFSKDDEIVELRKKSLRLISFFIALHWLVIMAFVPFVARAIDLENKTFEIVPRKLIFPEPNQAYNEILGKFLQEKVSRKEINRYIGLIMPEDLPSILEKIKETGFNPEFSNSTFPKSYFESDEYKKRLRMNDFDLMWALSHSGRDTVDIITGFAKNPDMDWLLVGRAKLGDKSVKQKLEAIYLKRLISEPDRESEAGSSKVRTGNVIGALACISEPEEAVGYFLGYIESLGVEDMIFESYLFDNIQLLPSKQAREVIKGYLSKVSGYQAEIIESFFGTSDYTGSRKLSPLRRIAGLYGDAYIADEILKIQLLMDSDDYYDMDISQYLTAESIPLLKEGLSGKNDKLRAWCVWQLRKLGYDWEKGELDKLLKDEDWYVRTNAGWDDISGG